ncbi:MarR family winged helix-turn-helix transcriptional regulator [Actinocatenispora rupis]|uniref:HTH marR-type domain-containing protein n=1 Tax=Actinocatenispora rupis TaxID=519421 RepID=A0A8J3JHG3_9ACTN|nr:MarR family transcriptional regulator [Actinocatenispora rupis]GID15003.1 hypothetical protein Aru02nite_58920 [Actinocatenispora rupis]
MSDEVLTAFDALFELTTRLGESMRADLGAHGLNPARAEVLLVLHRRGPVVQRELSQILRVTPRHVTGLVDTLAEQGWVARTPHPSDRRAVLVGLTDAGTAQATEMHRRRAEAARAWLGDVDPADLTTFRTVLGQVLDRLGSSGER